MLNNEIKQLKLQLQIAEYIIKKSLKTNRLLLKKLRQKRNFEN